MRLTRLAARGLRPRFPDWTGRPSVLRERFGHLTAPLSPTQPLMPVWTADAGRWGANQESSFASHGCVCPDGPAASPGTSDFLLVAKNTGDPNMLDLSWNASCLAAANDYSVHEGTIGAWYDHSLADCSTDGLTSATHTPAPGDRYLLIVPLSDGAEGSYGADSTGTQRPRSTATCRVDAVVDPCP